jgi:hypothetical protein
MDKTIRRNEVCIIGFPRCDFVFSSTRSCFIATGSDQGSPEVSILKRLLQDRGIHAIESNKDHSRNAFCTQICSKIITSQFCAIFLNNDEHEGADLPSINNSAMLGLMLGFNKYLVPFQRSNQKCRFNFAGLNIIKYTDREFEQLAAAEIDNAIIETRQDAPPSVSPDQILEVFLLKKKALLTPVNTNGIRSLFQIGAPLGFTLLNDFSGTQYMLLGNFTALHPDVVAWRLKMLREILDDRRATLDRSVRAGATTEKQARLLDERLNSMRIWTVVNSDDDKRLVKEALANLAATHSVEFYSLQDIESELEMLAT